MNCSAFEASSILAIRNYGNYQFFVVPFASGKSFTRYLPCGAAVSVVSSQFPSHRGSLSHLLKRYTLLLMSYLVSIPFASGKSFTHADTRKEALEIAKSLNPLRIGDLAWCY